MKIRYDGVEYEQITVQRGAAPIHLIEMRAQSERAGDLMPDGPLGLVLLGRYAREARAYGRSVEAWKTAVAAGTATEDDEPEAPDCAVWLSVANLFVTLRQGGWEGSLLDVAAIPPGDVEYIAEPLDGALDDGSTDATEVEADPTVPASSGGPGTPGLDAGPVVESPTA